MNPYVTRRVSTAAACLAIVSLAAAGCSKTQEATKDVASSASSAASSAASVATSAASSAVAAAGTTTLYYPDQEGALFSITAPDTWKVGKIEQVGDFGTVESADGSVLQFRAQSFPSDAETKQEIDAIVDSTKEFLKDNYVDVVLDNPEDVNIDGNPGTQLAGTGKDKNGNAVKFMSAMIMLGPTSLAEIWAAVFPEGNNDLDTAKAILDSFKPAKAQ